MDTLSRNWEKKYFVISLFCYTFAAKLNIKRANIQICFNMARKIEVSPEVRKQLSAEFGISETSVYKALGYVTDSELANKVRERAIEKGGREWYSKDD